jgi:hypothetical protein
MWQYLFVTFEEDFFCVEHDMKPIEEAVVPCPAGEVHPRETDSDLHVSRGFLSRRTFPALMSGEQNCW